LPDCSLFFSLVMGKEKGKISVGSGTYEKAVASKKKVVGKVTAPKSPKRRNR
jgi:hypothetical protein